MAYATKELFIGWDVGGWNCDRNGASRDALVVMDDQLQVLGQPWRGNLRALINTACGVDDFVRGMLELCSVDGAAHADASAVLGIDTPLGFSSAFRDLLMQGKAVPMIGSSATNPYLFRETERFLHERGLSPMSALKDMIGSQATKGMHVLAAFFPRIRSCGVWIEGCVSAIEVYPSSAKRSSEIEDLRQRCLDSSQIEPISWHDDERDALTCALIAWMYRYKPESVAQPNADTPIHEGWIFVPLDGLKQ